jgi:tRNA uridine 5-carboxymethylaminomethyl modification enzyme
MTAEYDIIVVGAGHAGCEAAAAAANLGSKVLLITMNMNNIAQMSCNPAMGGIAKGQIIREIDALGGYSGYVSDASAIQFRMLNLSKGPAMWSPRTQNDRQIFSKLWRETLESIHNIDFWQDSVTQLIITNYTVIGVTTNIGVNFYAKAVIVTTGTFLNGKIHIGLNNYGGGRMGEAASFGITEQLKNLGFQSGRMKTGTPPRIDGRTLNYTVMEEQKGDNEEGKFSYFHKSDKLPQRSCYITYTNHNVHNELRTGFDQSPMFNGNIEGLGPRYCPSIEDKINRFADRNRHQIFVEPEGLNTHEIYVNGFSTSLPLDIQTKAIRLIPGFENAKLFRPGYAIEYDFFQPTQLFPTLETKHIKNLFFAGQINGTTGYEEAAAQGIISGINANRTVINDHPFILKRNEAYIGVLVDDLINKGTEEPYRMFTSRAEFRILLRQDNAHLRLSEKAYHIGLISEKNYSYVQELKNDINKATTSMKKFSVDPDIINPVLGELNSQPIIQKTKLSQILQRPNISIFDLLQKNLYQDFATNYNPETLTQAEIEIKYAHYIKKEQELTEKIIKNYELVIKADFDYDKLHGLSSEAKEKFKKIKPQTVGQALNISGISPADISILYMHIAS